MKNNNKILDVNSLLIFAKVAENESFTKAAVKLGIEKSTVSNKISDLEKNLGVRLLNRNTRSVALTESGEGYYQYCKRIVDNAIEAEEYVRACHKEPQGLLKISGPPGIGRILFKDLFGSFLDEYKDIDVEILLTGKDIDVQRDRIDVALKTGMAPPREAGTSVRRIFDFNWGFYASPDYIRIHGDIRTVAQLEEHFMIHFLPPKLHTCDIRQGCPSPEEAMAFPPTFTNRLTINQIDPCISAIRKGLGVGILPIGSVNEEIRSGRLVQVLSDCRLRSMSIYAAYPARQWQTPRVQVFLDFLERWGQGHNQPDSLPAGLMKTI